MCDGEAREKMGAAEVEGGGGGGEVEDYDATDLQNRKSANREVGGIGASKGEDDAASRGGEKGAEEKEERERSPKGVEVRRISVGFEKD